MKNYMQTLVYASVVVVIVVAILLISLIFGWVSTDDAQESIRKILAATGVVVLAVIAIAALGNLGKKD